MRFFHSSTSVFLGSLDGYDLFFDNPLGMATVVARFGHNPPDYNSGLYWADFDPLLARAKDLAVEAGLISEDDIETATDVDDDIASCPNCVAKADDEIDPICEYHMEELLAHYSCLEGEEAQSHQCGCVH